jgi:hypothetical protein
LIVPDGTWTEAILQLAELWCEEEFIKAHHLTSSTIEHEENKNKDQQANNLDKISIETLIEMVYKAVERAA